MRAALQAVGGAVVGATAMLAVLAFMPWPRLDLTPLAILAVVLTLPVVFLLIVACHEGGHLVAGALARFTPCLFIVGPLKLERTSAGWRLGRNRVFPVSGGLVAATPNGIRRLRERMTVLVSGGPGASVAAGLVALGILAAQDYSRQIILPPSGSVAFIVTFLFGFGSLLVGFIALVPGQGHGFSTDGARILRFLRNEPSVEAEVALLGLVGASMSGERPRTWDQDLVARILDLSPDTPYGVAARLLAHSHALDVGDEAKARGYLLVALRYQDVLPVMSRPSLLLQAAYFSAAHDHDVQSARAYLVRAGQGALLSPHSRPMAEGAILLEAGDPRAADVLRAAAEAVPHTIDRGAAALAADLIERLRRRKGPSQRDGPVESLS